MLFRHMFYCKHVERLLCNVWISNKDFRQYSLHSAKWWAATNLRWLPVKVSTSRTFLPFVLTTCVQVRCRVRPPTANAQLCAEHSVLHDVWGDGAHLACHGEQPENGEWLKKDPWGALRRRRAGFRENVILSSFLFFFLQASNIDDVLCHHTSFLDNCLKDCMLTNPELLRIFSKLMSVCVMFTNCMQVFPRLHKTRDNEVTASIM